MRKPSQHQPAEGERPSPRRRHAKAVDRLQRLQVLAAALSHAVTSAQVADVIVAQGMAALDACTGVLAVLNEGRAVFECLRMVGYPPEMVEAYRTFPADGPWPIAEAVREGRPILLENLTQRKERYSAAGSHGAHPNGAAVAVPMKQGDVEGGLWFGFAGDRSFDEEDRTFLAAVADLGAQALERARLYDAERAARQRAEREVEDRKAAERALRESEERLRTLSDNLPLGAVYQIVGDGAGGRRFSYVSAGVAGMLGVTPAEVMADAGLLHGLIHDQDKPRLAAGEEAAVRNMAAFDGEFRSWTRSGRLRWIHCRSAPRLLPDGQLAWEGVVMDVTDRKKAEEALDRERELLQAIIDTIPVMITVYEPDTKVLRLNPAFERIVGWSTREAAGVSLMEQCYPDPECRERVAEFMRSCRDGWMDIRMTTRDGREIETSWANVRLSDATHIGIGIDISDRKRMEQTLREADRRKDEFLAMLGHELRNPLAPIRNAVQVLGLLGSADPHLQTARDVIDRQVMHMTRLVDDLLDVSRITRGKVRLHKERIDLASIVAAAVEHTRPAFESRRRPLAVTMPPETLWLEGDRTRLAQVLGNLLTNAAKYSEGDGDVSLTAARDAGEVVVRVRDQGVGIPSELLPHVFDLFTQGQPTLARSEGGLGVGLTVVKSLVEMHGGRVEAHSDGPGRGSEFVVRLPLLPIAEHPEPPAVKDAAPQAPARRVLVVDDNRDAADSMAVILRAGGHEVATAYDGPSGAAAALEFLPDVVLLDLGLPGMSGYEVAVRLRQEPALRRTLLIAVTGYGQEEDRRRARLAGFDVHLVKPTDPEAINALLAADRAGE
ncbi:MAG TPA: ATP-binding protein [Gemmataceae bacterium]|nr:ATP-binding protein [Gemmataceae bacterium]